MKTLRKIALAYVVFAPYLALAVAGRLQSPDAAIGSALGIIFVFLVACIVAGIGYVDKRKYAIATLLWNLSNFLYIACLIAGKTSFISTECVFFAINVSMALGGWSLLMGWDATREPASWEVVEPGVGLAEKKALADQLDDDALHRLAEHFKQQRKNGDLDDE